MASWNPVNVTNYTVGNFRIVISPNGGKATDVTFFRNVPTQIQSYSSADPFGDSTAVIQFPQVTIFDDIGNGDLAWLKDFADVDIWLATSSLGLTYDSTTKQVASGSKASYADIVAVINRTLLTAEAYVDIDPNNTIRGLKVWEGYISSFDYSQTQDSDGVTIQCKGALFQLDNYVQGPSFPPRPIVYEAQIFGAMYPRYRPHLRTTALTVEFPLNWPVFANTTHATVYTPVDIANGAKWTGYASRSTGSWDRTLTSFIQNMLQVMLVSETGDQWTIRKDAGRRPVLYVRKRAYPNVLPNPGFIGSSGWSPTGNATFDNTIGHSGNTSGKMLLNSGFNSPTPYPNVSANTFVRAGTWFYQDTASLILTFRANFLNAAGSTIASASVNAPTSTVINTWMYLDSGLIHVPNGTTNVNIQFVYEQGPTGTMHIDDSSFAQAAPYNTFNVIAGTPGIQVDVTRDLTQYANLVFGQGTDFNGVTFQREEVSANGSATAYDPMAYLPQVFPAVNNPRYDPTVMLVETYIKYDNGFDESQAIGSARETLRRDSDPGLAGTLTLQVDPGGISRYAIKAGDQVTIQYLLGSGPTGYTFHIAEVGVDIPTGTVTCKIDTQYRDLLTLEQVLTRQRDPLTPAKMLQINKRSVTIEDAQAPWDYTKGCGLLPKSRYSFFSNMSPAESFPYAAQTEKYQPPKYGGYYITCNAHASTRAGRWAIGFQILTSAKGTIRRTEIAAYDRYGKPLAVPFHFSVYYTHVTTDSMPYDRYGPSPFIANAFQSTDKYGNPITQGGSGVTTLPQSSLIIGWGNAEQPAGYSPGSKTSGNPVTGQLIDDSTWTYDCTNNPDFNKYGAVGTEPSIAISLYGAFYCEHSDVVYFAGRLFHQDSGTSV